MNWKNYVQKQNEKAYVLPEGWDSRESVAEQLECSPDRVDDQLRPGLKSGEIQKQQFDVWDSKLMRKIRVVAYSQPGQSQAPQSAWTGDDDAKARAMRGEGKTYAEIGAAISKSAESVRKRLKRG